MEGVRDGKGEGIFVEVGDGLIIFVLIFCFIWIIGELFGVWLSWKCKLILIIRAIVFSINNC